MTGTAVGYVYSELQVVGRCLDESDAGMVGHRVVAIRVDLSADAPSKVLVLGMADALNLYNDLARILEEYGNL